MSKNGETATISDIKLTTASYYYGRKADDFKMNQIEGQSKSSLSVLRLSEDGNAYVIFDGFQITWGEFK